MENQDIRWKQRFQNFEKALCQLSEGIEKYGNNPENIIKEGTIQRFEFTHELAWKVMKDFLEEEGIQNIMGSKSATRESFNKGLVVEGQIWMDMIKSRNETVHTYNEDILEVEYNNITQKYYPVIKEFYAKMKTFL
jgi:nucleotidyltransferase substrate binding protein (TIGR01987 family)